MVSRGGASDWGRFTSTPAKCPLVLVKNYSDAGCPRPPQSMGQDDKLFRSGPLTTSTTHGEQRSKEAKKQTSKNSGYQASKQASSSKEANALPTGCLSGAKEGGPLRVESWGRRRHPKPAALHTPHPKPSPAWGIMVFNKERAAAVTDLKKAAKECGARLNLWKGVRRGGGGY